jgi:hypothetical protein
MGAERTSRFAPRDEPTRIAIKILTIGLAGR